MPGLVAGCRLGVSLVPRPPDLPSPGTKSGCPNPAGPSRSTSTWGLRGPAGRSGWQFMVCGTSSLPTRDLSRRCFPWKAAPMWNPLPGRQAALPQVLAEFTGRRGGAERGWRPPGKGPFPSEMTNGFPQLQASAPAHSGVQRPCSSMGRWSSCVLGVRGRAGSPLIPPRPAQSQGLQRA